ncbi:MAG TPA: hypothetical protein VLV86_10975 [Vicinamibacterales bacterium]|nr:hypothetical protein [Vicinamibacterales bacterium]
MKVRFLIVAVSGFMVGTVATTRADVVARGTESADQSTSSSSIHIVTPDRNIVPLITDTKKTEEPDGAQRAESVTRVRLNDGGYFDWKRTTTVKKETAPGTSEILQDVVEKDRQGGDRTVQRSVETVATTDDGEKSQTKIYTRNSSGQLVLDRVVSATSAKEEAGREDTTRVEQAPDVNGNLILQKQTLESTAKVGPNETVTTAQTRSANHLTGGLDVTEESTRSIRTDGATKEIETVVCRPGRTGWEVAGRTMTTETTAPDGSVSRETIESGRSLYSSYTGNQMLEPLVPQRKVVERETRQDGGTVAVERQVFRRDVNGDWQPESFSTRAPTTAIGEHASAPSPPQQPAPETTIKTPPETTRAEPH